MIYILPDGRVNPRRIRTAGTATGAKPRKRGAAMTEDQGRYRDSQEPAGRPSRAPFNIMEPGEGTPWEDRGNIGTLLAFLRTCKLSLRRPAHLFRSIRRPESTRDATVFIIVAGVAVSLSLLVHRGLQYAWIMLRAARTSEPGARVVVVEDVQAFFRGTAILAILAPLLLWVLVRYIITPMFSALAAAEQSKFRVPRSLTYNLHAYCMGPLILSLVPVIGPVCAAVGVIVLMILAARRRQHMSLAGASTCSIITGLTALALVLGLYFLMAWIWSAAAPEAKYEKQIPIVRPRSYYE